MAKATKPKKPVIQSTHSRAARRATSPSINLDKSLKNLKAPEEDVISAATLAAKEYAGVSKKQKQKPMSRQQRLRKEKGMEKADAFQDKTQTKIIKSKSKGRIVRDRAIAWDELNQEVEPKRVEKKDRAVKDKKTKPVDGPAGDTTGSVFEAMEGVEEENWEDDNEPSESNSAIVQPLASTAEDDELDFIT